MNDEKKKLPSIEYYARNEEEKERDSKLKCCIYNTGSRADGILYMQNLEILSMLRHIEDELKEIRNETKTE